MLLAALVLRAVGLDNPMVDVDEQFYLLVADRMLDGALPYVDIWDRKPIGLFLIYAAARLLGGDGILAYQLLATLFAGSTAFFVFLSARRLSNDSGGWLAALAYLLWLNLMAGYGGQSPVFYNLPMAVAGWLLLCMAMEQALPPRRLLVHGALAMLLVGLAIQIKYTALFEGFYFGCALLWLVLARRMGAVRFVLFGALWAGLAVLPTIAAAAWYWHLGYLDPFVYANFLSIGERLPAPNFNSVHRFAMLSLILLPLLSFALLARWWAVPVERDGQGTARWLVHGWALAAVAAVIWFGNFFDHYGLPVALPGAVAGGATLANWRRIWPYIAFWFLIAFAAGQILLATETSNSGGRRTIRQMNEATQGLRNCPFIYDGPSIPYLLNNWCFSTVYPFPYHLSYQPEMPAMGVDVPVEIDRIMARRPDAVIIRHRPYTNENPRSRARVLEWLRRDYRPVGAISYHLSPLIVYRLKPGLTPLPNDIMKIRPRPYDPCPGRTLLGQDSRLARWLWQPRCGGARPTG